MDKQKYIVFDLDDTLFKEIDFVKSAYMYIASQLSDFGNPAGIYRLLLDAYLNHQDAFRCLNERLGLDLPIARYLSWYRYHEPTISLSPGAKEVLDDVLEKGWGLGLITDGRSISQRNKLAALGIEKYFDKDDIMISEELGAEKISGKPFAHFRGLHPDGEEFVYIGDNTSKDFRQPNLQGWRTIGLRDSGENIHKQDKHAAGEDCPQIWIERLDQLPGIL